MHADRTPRLISSRGALRVAIHEAIVSRERTGEDVAVLAILILPDLLRAG